jgi:hypothetical protein
MFFFMILLINSGMVLPSTTEQSFFIVTGLKGLIYKIPSINPYRCITILPYRG